jgi:hypothetical protein
MGAPVPLAPTVQSATETVTPTEVVGVAFCAVANSGWNANRWYVTHIDAVQQAWAGALQPTDTSGSCYRTPNFYSFPVEGLHELKIALVNHCEPNDMDGACQTCAAANGGVPCADAYSAGTPIAVTSSSNPVVCTLTLAPTTATVPTAGGTGTVTVTANDPSCKWTAVSDAAWLTVTPASGQGSGAVSYSASSTTAGARSGNITIAGLKVFVTQTGAPCTFTLDPTSGSLPASGGQNSISVNMTGGGGCPWSASSPVPWVTFTSVSGMDSGVAGYTVIANPDPPERKTTLTVAGLPYTLTQIGTMTDLCAPGAAEAPTITYLRVMPTNPKSAQPMNPQYQLASKTAITNIVVRMNGTIVGQLGPGATSLTSDGGQWFNAPARGTYVMTIEIANVYGCHRTTSNIGVTVR